MPRLVSLLMGLLLLLPLLAPRSASAGQGAPAAGSPVATAGDFAGLVGIGGGRRLWLECRGTGSPTVVLEAGAGNDADSWDTVGLSPGQTRAAVLPSVAGFARVCAYDRPGTVGEGDQRSRSDPVPMPRTAADVVADLHALLVAAKVPGPYVLVGHSFGGLTSRLYADTYPDEVAGLVLVDAAHEDWYQAVRAALSPAQRAEYDRLAAEGPPELAGDPNHERLDTDASAEEMRRAALASPLRPMPLAVITHGRPWDWPAGYPTKELETTWRTLQERLAGLTPDARLVVAAGSGHFVPGDRPDVIVDAVREVVDAVRNPGSWPTGSAGAAAPATPAAAATPVAAGSGTQLTPLLDSVLSPPRWFVGSDGRARLVYELALTNALPAEVTVHEVEVRDADSGTVLLRLSGDALRAAMSLATTPNVPDVRLPPSSVGVVWLEVPLASVDAIPMHLTHRLSIDPLPDVPVAEDLLTFTGRAVAVDQRPPVVLGPPLFGPGWATLGSCCDGPHRRALLPIDGQWFLAQRFAIDFNQLDAENRPGTGDPRLPTSFPTFGQPVLAVADATVAEAVDRYPDLLVGQAREDVTPVTAGGNRIVLDLGGGRFAVYAHLHAGSVAVRPGDRVRRGQVIAAVGSSGTGGGPHLHFQVADRPSVIVADGLPYEFDAFTVTGRTPPLADVLPYYDSMEPIPVSTEGAGPRRDELPLGSDVLSFP